MAILLYLREYGFLSTGRKLPFQLRCRLRRTFRLLSHRAGTAEKESERKEIYTKAPSSIEKYLSLDTELKSDVTLDDLVDAFQKFLERKKERASGFFRCVMKAVFR